MHHTTWTQTRTKNCEDHIWGKPWTREPREARLPEGLRVNRAKRGWRALYDARKPREARFARKNFERESGSKFSQGGFERDSDWFSTYAPRPSLCTLFLPLIQNIANLWPNRPYQVYIPQKVCIPGKSCLKRALGFLRGQTTFSYFLIFKL